MKERFDLIFDGVILLTLVGTLAFTLVTGNKEIALMVLGALISAFKVITNVADKKE